MFEHIYRLIKFFVIDYIGRQLRFKIKFMSFFIFILLKIIIKSTFPVHGGDTNITL